MSTVYASCPAAEHAVLLARVDALRRGEQTQVSSPDRPPRLFGYTSAFSACAGQTLSFHVSGEKVDAYVAQLVKLRHGHDGPGSLGLREAEVESAIDGPHSATFHEARPGSSVVIDDPDGALVPGVGLELGVLLWATTPQRAERQGILGAWSEDDRAGYAIYLEQGQIVFVVGDGRDSSTLRIETPVQPRTWYAITAGWNRDRDDRLGSAGLLRWCGCLAWTREPTVRREASFTVGASSTAPFRIAALSRRADGEWAACSSLQRQARGAVGREHEGGSDHSRFVAVSSCPRVPTGCCSTTSWTSRSTACMDVTVNQPTRGVTGHNWSARTDSYRQSPDEYGAIHFHEDDLADLEWPTAFELDDSRRTLTSGVYAARLRGEGCEEHIPFFVRPAPDGPRQRVAVLFPTGSYLAYANDRLPLDVPGRRAVDRPRPRAALR